MWEEVPLHLHEGVFVQLYIIFIYGDSDIFIRFSSSNNELMYFLKWIKSQLMLAKFVNKCFEETFLTLVF